MCLLSNNFSPSYISPVPITQSVNFIQNLSNKCGYATGINTAVNKKNRCSFKRSPFTYQHPLCMIADGGRIRWSELCVGHRTRWCQLLWGCICSTNYVILPTHKIWQWDQLANFSFFFFHWLFLMHGKTLSFECFHESYSSWITFCFHAGWDDQIFEVFEKSTLLPRYCKLTILKMLAWAEPI